ncbi:hypothetical protein JCM33374_g5046 [Metschnikowia sp. JCM 33374]|nr:hypothetical protein JCM33374_g5046 [Metschnikowia sp. JCM 33374]
MFSDDIPNGLSSTFINAIKALIAASSSVQTYMHLYLIILLLLFPVIIASDQEVTSSLKAQLRTSMRNCTAKVGSEIAQLVSLDTFKLKTFTGILEKMIRLNEMTNTKVKSCSPGSVAEQIAKDLAGAGGAKNDPVTSLSIVEESCFRVVSLYFNAYEFDINEGTTRESKLENNIAINYVTQALSEAAMLTAEMIQRISMSAKNDGLKDVAPDVPYQIFVLAVGILHEFTLTNAVIARLPSLMLNCMIAQSVGELQHIIFSAFRNRESELAKETFKTWWVFSMMFHEYKCILREVVALNQQLSELG